MTENDNSLIRVRDVVLALSLLSRLPVRVSAHDRSAEAAWAYPLVGVVLGTLAALGALVAQRIGLPAPLAALVALGLLIMLSGAMHEDGLADSADGLWGGWDRQKRLENMKDSHIGSYGVLALILSLGARWCALWLLFQTGPATGAIALIAAATLSRGVMPALMAALPHARETGLSHRVGRVTPMTAALALALAGAFGVAMLGAAGISAVLCAGLAALGTGAIARAKIGGQTGDILGATQNIAEIAVLFSLLV
ncbi:MAG: adenosylcobinamide-GDP ribazoletransferase [Roseovarius sp.]|jgi:adenosylcobinamide-GDP ribazoletransferase|nr:adenosylcobinamide-GDP ribazoletransferase [Roseovarius sp.]